MYACTQRPLTSGSFGMMYSGPELPGSHGLLGISVELIIYCQGIQVNMYQYLNDADAGAVDNSPQVEVRSF